jgi:hypothetical protein
VVDSIPRAKFKDLACGFVAASAEGLVCLAHAGVLTRLHLVFLIAALAPFPAAVAPILLAGRVLMIAVHVGSSNWVQATGPSGRVTPFEECRLRHDATIGRH